MKKGITVNYPKKKPKMKLEDLGDVKEPERYSMYQVLMENLQLAKRTTYLHRMIYLGEHTFPSFDEARCVFQRIINMSNETYCIEKLTGFFLFYPNYFVHMVEGDEDNLNKHLKFLLDKNAQHFPFLGTMKLLIHVSHINQRFIDSWIVYTGIPSTLLEKLDVDADLQYSARFIYNCIKKMYSLISNYVENLQKSELDQDIKSMSASSLDTIAKAGSLLFSLQYMGSSQTLEKPAAHKEYVMFLPEYELIHFAIKTHFTMHLSDYNNLYGVVPMRDIYKDRVWPVPHDFIPFDIFEKPYNCVTELAKKLRTTTTTFTSNITIATKEDNTKTNDPTNVGFITSHS